MTDTTTAAIEALLTGVTKGPWLVEEETLFGQEDGYTVHLFDLSAYEENENADADARFIAAARDLVPALAADRDAAIRAAKVGALRKAEVATLGLATGHECRAAILALIGEGV